jgi:hypothetical protein
MILEQYTSERFTSFSLAAGTNAGSLAKDSPSSKSSAIFKAAQGLELHTPRVCALIAPSFPCLYFVNGRNLCGQHAKRIFVGLDW